MFTIREMFKQDKYSFHIYNHSLTMEMLDNAISEIIFKNEVLTYLFTGVYKKVVGEERKLMLRRFIPVEFFYKEKKILDD